MTPDAERLRLLKIAREAIRMHLTRAAILAAEEDGRRAGAFVSLHRGDQLRGCIGHIEADDLLARIVARCAVAAATEDPRFSPIEPSELEEVSIELSVLGPLEPIVDVDVIQIGRHGLVIEDGWRRGLLLPQVAVEWKWDRDQFLAHTCRKAGLAPHAWKRGSRLWVFEAEVFGDDDFSASIA